MRGGVLQWPLFSGRGMAVIGAEQYVHLTDGARLALRRQGNGPGIVWAHALMSSMADEQARVPAWHAARDLVRFDARGHGSSANPAPVDPRTLDWPALGNDMLAVADACRLQRWIAGGVSMGGMSALCAALAAPGRVRALVLVSPPPVWEARAPHAEQFARAAQIMARRAVRHPEAAATATQYRGAALANLPPREAFACLSDMPALMIAWPGDPGHPLASAHALHAVLPRSRLVVLADQHDEAGCNNSIGLFLQQLP